jgi:hypothetical protein
VSWKQKEEKEDDNGGGGTNFTSDRADVSCARPREMVVVVVVVLLHWTCVGLG